MKHTESPPQAALASPLAAASHATILTPTNQTQARYDGWTPQRQRLFCQTLAETGRVKDALKAVGMSKQSAYEARRRPSGRAFGLAWDAALILSQQRLVSEAVELAFDGSVEIIEKDGVIIGERRKRDARSILATLEKLKGVDALSNPSAQIVSQDFDSFLDMFDEELSPADDDDEEDAVSTFLLERGGKAGKKPLARGPSGQFLPRYR